MYRRPTRRAAGESGACNTRGNEGRLTGSDDVRCEREDGAGVGPDVERLGGEQGMATECCLDDRECEPASGRPEPEDAGKDDDGPGSAVDDETTIDLPRKVRKRK